MNDFEAAVQDVVGSLPEDYRAVMSRSLSRLRESGIEGRALSVGDRAPDFALPNQRGELVRLSALLEGGPVVLNFYRGEWCPICQFEFKALENVASEISALGGRLVSITPELPSMRAGAVADRFEKLHDAYTGVGLSYGLVFRVDEEFQDAHRRVGIDLTQLEGNESWMLPIPATYLVGTDGIIAFAFIDVDYTRRVEPADIIAKLRELRA